MVDLSTLILDYLEIDNYLDKAVQILHDTTLCMSVLFCLRKILIHCLYEKTYKKHCSYRWSIA